MRKARDLPGTSIGQKLGGVSKTPPKKGTPMPHSKASLMLLPGGRRVLDPPSEFGDGSVEREIFVKTVLATPPDHFAPEDVVLLAEYCRTAAMARRASDELAVSAVAGSMPSPWLAVHASAVRSLATLSTRLRLGPRSRSHNTRKSKLPLSPPSYYDLQRQGSTSLPEREPSW